MAFIHCRIEGCNKVREVKPYGPAYYTFGLCYIHLQCEEVVEVSNLPLDEKRPRLTLPPLASQAVLPI